MAEVRIEIGGCCYDMRCRDEDAEAAGRISERLKRRYADVAAQFPAAEEGLRFALMLFRLQEELSERESALAAAVPADEILPLLKALRERLDMLAKRTEEHL
jgi:hypothetical protein